MFFRNDYFFLSNFYPASISWAGHHFPSAEHLYQALKCTDPAEMLLIRTAGSPGQAKRLGSKVISIRSDWDTVRVDVMRDVVWEKFRQNPTLARRLKALVGVEIVEENTWGDTFWGVCRGQGLNTLGLILTDIRERLASGRGLD